MELDDQEEALLRSVALQNARAVLLARERAERELLEAKQSLEKTAERLRLALEAGELGDWSWDAATDLVTFGPRVADVFGVPSGRPMTWTDLRQRLHEEDRERARLAVEQALATRKDYRIEYRVQRSAGEWLWVAARGRGVYGAKGEVMGMIGV